MINEAFPIPTGYLFTGNYSKGQLETLSIGDYGKHTNIKADFLGYDRELSEGVPEYMVHALVREVGHHSVDAVWVSHEMHVL